METENTKTKPALLELNSGESVDSFNVYMNLSKLEFKDNKEIMVANILNIIANSVVNGNRLGNILNENDELLATYDFKIPKELH
jgi:hypothetical protein